MAIEPIMQSRTITIEELGWIAEGISTLADLAVKQADYVAAEKLRTALQQLQTRFAR